MKSGTLQIPLHHRLNILFTKARCVHGKVIIKGLQLLCTEQAHKRKEVHSAEHRGKNQVLFLNQEKGFCREGKKIGFITVYPPTVVNNLVGLIKHLVGIGCGVFLFFFSAM